MKNIKSAPLAITCLVALLGVGCPTQGTANSDRGMVKDWIDDSSEFLKKGIDSLEGDVSAIQDCLNNYQWKGLIQDKATSGPVTLKHLELNDHSRAIVVRPGEQIAAEVKCILDSNEVDPLGVYRVVIGIKGEGPQTTIGNEIGFAAKTSREKFTLNAPDKAGIYEVRFRCVDALFKSTGLEAWKDEGGNEPDATTTIGIIVVR